MHAYPCFTGSYQENQVALLEHLGLTHPGQAPFGHITSFPPFPSFLTSSTSGRVTNPACLEGGAVISTEEARDGSRRVVRSRLLDEPEESGATLVLSRDSQEPESLWLLLAFSVIALHHCDTWPETNAPDEVSQGDNSWCCHLEPDDFVFLKGFFGEKWESLEREHPFCRHLLARGVIVFERLFDQKTESGREALLIWLRWIIELVWKNHYAISQGKVFSQSTAPRRAIELTIKRLGSGALRLTQPTGSGSITHSWLLHAIFLMQDASIMPNQRHIALEHFEPGNGMIGPSGRSSRANHITLAYYPFESKFARFGHRQLAAKGLTIGFGGYVHPSAFIGNDVTLGHYVFVGPGAHIGNRVVIKERAHIGAGVSIGPEAQVGVGATLLGVTRDQPKPVIIGSKVVLQAGVIIEPGSLPIPPGYTVTSLVLIKSDTRFCDPEGTIVVLENGQAHRTIYPSPGMSARDHRVLVC
jgi:tetrahydrodipicolinate N-succinyltransferase